MRPLQEIKSGLQARVHVSGTLLSLGDIQLEGYRSGRSFITRCPWRADNRAGSFAVYVVGDRIGNWVDFAADRKGDVLELVAGVLAGDPKAPEGLTKALKWGRDLLGLERMSNEDRRRFQEQAARRQECQAQETAQSLEADQRRAFGIWLNARDIRGTPAEGYLKARGIDIRALKHLPSALKFLPDQRHTETGTVWPVMLAAMTSTTEGNYGRVVAIHRTFLSGTAKAPLESGVRKMWPSAPGAVIQLARGETGLPVAKARQQGLLDTLCLCEGIETGLSIALAKPEWRVWAAYSLSNLARVRLPPTTAELVIARENDFGNPAATGAFDKAQRALAGQGVPVQVVRSWTGSDFNDALTGAA